MTVVEMVDNYLRQNGFDGLVSDTGECGCRAGELAPCGAMDGACEAGRLIQYDDPDEPGRARWAIVSTADWETVYQFR